MTGARRKRCHSLPAADGHRSFRCSSLILCRQSLPQIICELARLWKHPGSAIPCRGLQIVCTSIPRKAEYPGRTYPSSGASAGPPSSHRIGIVMRARCGTASKWVDSVAARRIRESLSRYGRTRKPKRDRRTDGRQISRKRPSQVSSPSAASGRSGGRPRRSRNSQNPSVAAMIRHRLRVAECLPLASAAASASNWSVGGG